MEAARRRHPLYGFGGVAALLEAIRLKFQRENGLDFGLDELIVGAGAKQLIHTALSATVQAGDEVIISAPYWVSYPDMVLVNDGTPVTVPCPEVDGFKLTPQALSAPSRRAASGCC